jgi:purine-binding chemotaxis protein CheW
MTSETNYILFVLNHQRYGVKSADVAEIVQLPELTVVPDAPRHLAGLFELEGRIVQVVDLSVWFNQPSGRYLLTDSVIVLRGSDPAIGILVNEVIDVCVNSRASAGLSHSDANTVRAVISHAVHIAGQIVLIPDIQKLTSDLAPFSGFADVRSSPEFDVRHAAAESGSRQPFFRDIPLDERTVFRERAQSLMREDTAQDPSEFESFVVIGLNREYIGVPMGCVREFAEVRGVTRVPCCPAHIVGNMNLRGEILTVIDIRPALKIPPVPAMLKNILVAVHDGITAGIIVDEIHEIAFLDPARFTDRSSFPNSAQGEYTVATVPFGSRTLTILNLPKLLTSAELVVNEEV